MQGMPLGPLSPSLSSATHMVHPPLCPASQAAWRPAPTGQVGGAAQGDSRGSRVWRNKEGPGTRQCCPYSRREKALFGLLHGMGLSVSQPALSSLPVPPRPASTPASGPLRWLSEPEPSQANRSYKQLLVCHTHTHACTHAHTTTMCISTWRHAAYTGRKQDVHTHAHTQLQACL